MYISIVNDSHSIKDIAMRFVCSKGFFGHGRSSGVTAIFVKSPEVTLNACIPISHAVIW